ncbi:MAG: hypothetical protein WDN28_09575 [Chthoniobacter sp.]
MATIQAQSFIQPAPEWAQYAVIAVLMLLSFRVPRLKKAKTIFCAVLVLAAYGLIALAVFARWLVWMSGGGAGGSGGGVRPLPDRDAGFLREAEAAGDSIGEEPRAKSQAAPQSGVGHVTLGSR